MQTRINKTKELTVWGRRSAFNVQKVLWTLDELACEYEHIEVGGAFGGLDSAEFAAMNPHKRVPVIKDGETIVWESHAIIRYLAAKYDPGRLWAASPSERARADQWMDWSQTTLQKDCLELFWALVRTPAPQQNRQLIDERIERCRSHYQLLDNWLQGQKYLLGDSLSLADISAGNTLYRYFEMVIPRPPIPNVRRWYSVLRERKPYQLHVMRPFDELRGRLEY